MLRILRLMAGLFLSCLIVTGLQAQTAASKQQGKRKKELVIAIADNGTSKRIEAIEPVANYLSKELGMKVSAIVARNALDLLDKIKAGEVDIAYINGFGYVLGKTDSIPLIPLVAPGNKDGSPNTYNSCIFTAPSSGIKSMADLVVQAQEYSLMFVNPTSTSGHLVPRLYLSKMGLKQLEVELKEVTFGNNHYSVIDQVMAGKADAGAAAYNIIESRLARGEMKKEDLNILWVSEGITQEPVVVHERMDDRLQKKITQAMLKIHTKNPELWQHIQQNFSAKAATRYVPAKDEYYNSIRNVSGKIEDLLFIMNFYLN